MPTPEPRAGAQNLPAGHTLFNAGQHGPAWQLTRGALRLDGATADGQVFVQLALPGDWLGVEAEIGQPYAFTARAIIPSQLSTPSPAAIGPSLALALQQQYRQALEALRLRSGTAANRLRELLLLLHGDASTQQHRPLPSLKDMGAIIGTAPETVSRILSSLRRSRVLERDDEAGTGMAARFDPQVLRAYQLPQGMTCSARGC